MLITKTVEDTSSQTAGWREKDLKIGFVPTMGALHKGHISLVEQALKTSDKVVVSIFVNPTQFNEKTDLDKYPRTPELDLAMLEKAGCDLVFMPTTVEIYPEGEGDGDHIDLGGLDKVWEGAHRPGHFKGVVQVVGRLLDIVEPNQLYLGQKDYQQVLVIKRMISELELDVQVEICPIIREEHGLAMSSRNERLSDSGRLSAGTIHKIMTLSAEKARDGMELNEVREKAVEELESTGEMKVEYFDFLDGNNLEAASSLEEHETILIATAVYLEGVRLIDNMII